MVEISKYCSECGKKVEGNHKFCPECGTDLLKKVKKKKIKQHEKNNSSSERFFKNCFLLSVSSVLVGFVITGIFNFPIRYMLYDKQLVHNFFTDLVFWSLIFFAIFLLVLYWKKLQIREIKVFISSIIIAFVFILIILGYNSTLDAGEIRVVEFSEQGSYFYYYLNGTIENTGEVYQNAILYAYFYDEDGDLRISENFPTYYDIEPHSTISFSYDFFLASYEDYVNSFLEIDHANIVVKTFGYDKIQYD